MHSLLNLRVSAARIFVEDRESGYMYTTLHACKSLRSLNYLIIVINIKWIFFTIGLFYCSVLTLSERKKDLVNFSCILRLYFGKRFMYRFLFLYKNDNTKYL